MSLKLGNLLKLIETQKPELTNVPTYTAPSPVLVPFEDCRTFMKIVETLKVTRASTETLKLQELQ